MVATTETREPWPEKTYGQYDIRFYAPHLTPAQLHRLGEQIGVLAGIASVIVVYSDFDLAAAPVPEPALESGAAAEVAALDQNGDIPYDAPFNPEQDLFDPDIQRRLDMPLEEIVGPEGASVRGHLRTIVNKLEVMGLFTVRDAILGGMDYLRSEPGFGRVSRARLVTRLAEVCPEIPIRQAWKPEYAAKFCRSLDQVRLYTLRYTPLGRKSAFPVDRFSISTRDPWQSIADFINRYEEVLTGEERTVRASALAFAGVFEAARQAQARPEG